MENERLDWLKSIYPEFEDKASLYGNVYRRTDLTYFHFFNKSRTFRGYIDPENIVGIDYGFAYNFDTVINWHELFIRLRRFRQIQGFKTKNELFNHVHSDYNEEKCVYKYGNHFFTYQGQHRLCLAKFLNIEKVQVEITEFELDKSWLIRFRKLKKATEKLLKKSMCGEYSFNDLIEASKSEYFYLNLLNFGGLLNGSTLYPYNVNVKGINTLVEWISNHKISIYHSVPTLFRSLIKLISQRLPSVRLIVLGGEAVFNRDFEGFKNKFGKDAIFINGYGPTESTIVCQKFLNEKCTTGYNVPIGRSVDRTKVYLIKSNNKPARVYEEGQIIYESDYLALGYYNDEELTNLKFKEKVDFQISDSNDRYYYSGDWGKLMPNGDIEFIGRQDNQIKFNGIRIELNEINFAVEQIEGVSESVTVFKKFQNDDLIACYITLKDNISREGILERLKLSLPAYMIPKAIIILKEIPLTNTGKINFNALPEIEESHLFRLEYIAAGNIVEKELEGIWKEILKINKVGMKDNFFDIGGNSMKAIELSNKLKIKYPDKNISPVIIFEYSNISVLAEFLSLPLHYNTAAEEEDLSIIENTLNIYNLDHNNYDE